jgi:hypothetical protein
MNFFKQNSKSQIPQEHWINICHDKTKHESLKHILIISSANSPSSLSVKNVISYNLNINLISHKADSFNAK